METPGKFPVAPFHVPNLAGRRSARQTEPERTCRKGSWTTVNNMPTSLVTAHSSITL